MWPHDDDLRAERIGLPVSLEQRPPLCRVVWTALKPTEKIAVISTLALIDLGVWLAAGPANGCVVLLALSLIAVPLVRGGELLHGGALTAVQGSSGCWLPRC